MSARSSIQSIRTFLPDGRALPEADWRGRHRVMTVVLAGHLPAIVGYALVTGASPLHALVEMTLPAVLLALALRHHDRRVQSLAVSLGLITCSAVFVHLSDGLIEWHFHYFVTLALVSLYKEWLVYLMALAFVVVQHGLGSWLRFNDVYNHGDGEMWWALVHGGFVLAASACHIAAWRFNETADARAEGYRRELQEGQQSVMAQLQQTAQIRSDLIATASHEFRTPLTVISGAAATLQRHRGVLSEAEQDALLSNISARADRLGLMLESMLIAAQVEPAEPASTPLATAVDEQFPAATRGQSLSVDVPEELWVGCGRRPLAQLIARMVDSARLSGDLGATIRLRAEAAAGDVRIVVTVAAAGLDHAGLAGIFEPFRGGTHAVPRSADVGLGLFAVRRIAESHGGTAGVDVKHGELVIEVLLPRTPVELPLPRAATVSPVNSVSIG